MSIRSAIYDLLNDVEADVYPLFAPQETTDPYVAYSIRTEPIRTQSGIVVTDVDLTLNIYANTYDEAVTLALALYTGLENASGTYDSETLMVCNWVSESEDYIPQLDKVNITQEYQLKFE
jgi:hypothetical protein